MELKNNSIRHPGIVVISFNYSFQGADAGCKDKLLEQWPTLLLVGRPDQR